MNVTLAAGLPATPLGKLLVALVAFAILVLVSRIVLNLAWKLLLVAIIVVGAFYTAGVLL